MQPATRGRWEWLSITYKMNYTNPTTFLTTNSVLNMWHQDSFTAHFWRGDLQRFTIYCASISPLTFIWARVFAVIPGCGLQRRRYGRHDVWLPFSSAGVTAACVCVYDKCVQKMGIKSSLERSGTARHGPFLWPVDLWIGRGVENKRRGHL